MLMHIKEGINSLETFQEDTEMNESKLFIRGDNTGKVTHWLHGTGKHIQDRHNGYHEVQFDKHLHGNTQMVHHSELKFEKAEKSHIREDAASDTIALHKTLKTQGFRHSGNLVRNSVIVGSKFTHPRLGDIHMKDGHAHFRGEKHHDPASLKAHIQDKIHTMITRESDRKERDHYRNEEVMQEEFKNGSIVSHEMHGKGEITNHTMNGYNGHFLVKFPSLKQPQSVHSSEMKLIKEALSTKPGLRAHQKMAREKFSKFLSGVKLKKIASYKLTDQDKKDAKMTRHRINRDGSVATWTKNEGAAGEAKVAMKEAFHTYFGKDGKPIKMYVPSKDEVEKEKLRDNPAVKKTASRLASSLGGRKRFSQESVVVVEPRQSFRNFNLTEADEDLKFHEALHQAGYKSSGPVGKFSRKMVYTHPTRALKEGDELSEGSHNEHYFFHAKDDHEARRHADSMLKSMIHQHGADSYAGHLGTCGTAVFKGSKKTEAEAETHAQDHHQKWDPAFLHHISEPKDDVAKIPKGHRKYHLGGWAAE